MNIAFVGKGGSGKSTISALYIQYLQQLGHPLIAVDADINIHLPILLGCELRPHTALSLPENTLAVKTYLKGDNPRITTAESIVKSTPAGQGSNFLTIDAQNPIIASFGVELQPSNYLLHVGTYDKDGIGESCYHTNLAIFESLLSHTHLRENEWLVADMVAGTDAFAGTLHAQFDLIVLVVEPTPEGVGVFTQFMELAEAAGVADYVCALGNKVDDEEDIAYLREHVGDKLIGALGRQSTLKRFRQSGQPIDLNQIKGIAEIFDLIAARATENHASRAVRHKLLLDLHRTHAQADYIIARHGDLTQQIDPDFNWDTRSL